MSYKQSTWLPVIWRDAKLFMAWDGTILVTWEGI